MVEKKYYWPDFKDTFTVKTEEGMKHGALMDEYDCDLIMNYLMYAADHLMTTSIRVMLVISRNMHSHIYHSTDMIHLFLVEMGF